MTSIGRIIAIGISGLAFVAAAQPALAETLTQALIEAYRHNPTLNAARAGLRATDENVPQALSGWRPTVGAAGTLQQNSIYSTGSSGNSYITPTQENLSIQLDQPLFRGFKTVEGTKQAEALVRQGRQQLLGTEEQVLLNATTAYANLLRDRSIVAIRKRDLSVLMGQDRATNERFKAGELTKTDVAQSRAGVASAQAALTLAIANVQIDEAQFAQYVGHMPGALSPMPIARPPESLAQALDIAGETNPNILAAVEAADAADHRIGVVKSGLLPSADLIGSYNYLAQQNASPTSPADQSTFFVEGKLSVPIYEQGLVYSQVRQAKQLASQSHLGVIDATRQVREAVAAAWQSLQAARQAVSSNKQSVSASSQAYEGVKVEFSVGSKSTIDVLNAEQTLLNAQIAETGAEHDEILASYQLQSAIGHLTAQHLHLGGLYDPAENYNDVHYKWIGTDAETLPQQ